MLTPRLTECKECADITALLSEIDCKLTDLAKAEYNNLVFSLNRPIQGILISDLLTYKRILTNRICNPDYACTYPLNQIASRVKTLHPIQCKPNCQEKDFRFFNPVSNVYPPTTIAPPSTTTTSSSSTTTTSSSTSTTSTSTTQRVTPVYNNAGVVCLDAYTIQSCSFGDCSRYYYNLLTCQNLGVGCTLYTDVNLTNVFVANPSLYYSNYSGGVIYQINTSGVIVNEITCPSPPPLYQHCSSFVAPKIDGTPFDVGGVTVTCTYSGDVRLLPSSYEVENTLDVLPANSAWLGRYANPFSLTFNFSQPISSINIYQAAGDAVNIGENYKYDTNSGIPTLTPHYINRVLIQSNLTTVTPNTYGGLGNVLLTVSNSTPFTSLTISGWNTPPGRPVESGSLFAICTQLV